MSWLDKVEEDLAAASENADRSAQTRLFVHHVPRMIQILRSQEPEEEEVVEEVEEEEEVSEESEEIEEEAEEE
jgi:hypothetical protein